MIDFAKRIPHTLGTLPTWHQWGIRLVGLAMCAGLWLPSPNALIPANDPNRLPLHQLIPLPLPQHALASKRSNPAQSPAEIQLDWQEFIIAQGDSLARLFEQAGLPAAQLQRLTQLPQVNNALAQLQPKQVIRLGLADGQLQQLHYQISPAESLLIEATAQGFQSRRKQSQLQTRQRYAQATISSNFWNAASQAGLTANTIMQLARIFGWDVDFALDIRQGDRFAVLWQDNYLDGEYLSEGDILAAEFINGDKRFRAIRHSDGNYYSAEGEAMKKAFLRAPILFNYVSSNFNPRRLHPVTGLIRPHNGTDYVAPVGTPV
ncbi:MAG: LysM-like peptidoglycan-binding domain-containing protein, partial [Ferrimonas sp.]